MRPIYIYKLERQKVSTSSEGSSNAVLERKAEELFYSISIYSISKGI